MMAVETSIGDIALKVAVFLIVQALVYVILSSSSNVFSNKMRSFSFKPARSSSINRILAAISDLPVGGDQASPSPKTTQSPSAKDQYFFNANYDQCSDS
ncbi:hypothetical protein PanWU01x14_118640 [Parasponia andersonii]|uniref:Transmembrane protein n=1 Tax=Parasponia andersonii TaxID=3476 RepID=A0A2P5CVU9_PARAD|nr:hypothetical protein PanWU01x14_118640 [Parasponia andersonii]